MPLFYTWRQKIDELTSQKNYEGLLKLVGKMRKECRKRVDSTTVRDLAFIAGNLKYGPDVDKEAASVLDELISSKKIERTLVFSELMAIGYIEGYIDKIQDSACLMEILNFLRRFIRARNLDNLPRGEFTVQIDQIYHGKVSYIHDDIVIGVEERLLVWWLKKAAALKIEGAAEVIREYLSADFLPSDDSSAHESVGDMLRRHNRIEVKYRVETIAWEALAELGESDAIEHVTAKKRKKAQWIATDRGIDAVKDAIRIVAQDLTGAATKRAIEKANIELRAGEGTASSRMAALIDSMFRSRSRDVLLALEACNGISSSPTLVNLLQEITEAPPAAPTPADVQFQPELVGNGRGGWTDQTASAVRLRAAEILGTLQP